MRKMRPNLITTPDEKPVDQVFAHVPDFDDSVRFQEHLKIDLGLAKNPNFAIFQGSRDQAEAYEQKSFDAIYSSLVAVAEYPLRVAAAMKRLENEHDDVLDNFDRSYFLREIGHRDAEYERVRGILVGTINSTLTPPTYPFPKAEEEEIGKNLDSMWAIPSVTYPQYWQKITDKRVKKIMLRRMIDRSTETGVNVAVIGAWLMYYPEIKAERSTNEFIDRAFEYWFQICGDVFLFDTHFLSRFSGEQVLGFVNWWARKNQNLPAFNQLESSLWKHFRDLFNYQGDVSVFPKLLQRKITKLTNTDKDPAKEAGSDFKSRFEEAGALSIQPQTIMVPSNGQNFQRIAAGGFSAEIDLNPNELLAFVVGTQKDMKQAKIQDIRLALVGDPETARVRVEKRKSRDAAQIINYRGVKTTAENVYYESVPDAPNQMISFANDRFSFSLSHKDAELVLIEFVYDERRVTCIYDGCANLNFPADFFGLTAEDIESGNRPTIKRVHWLKRSTAAKVGMHCDMKAVEEPEEIEPDIIEELHGARLSGKNENGVVSLNIPAFWPPGCSLHVAILRKSAKNRVTGRQHRCFSHVGEMMPFEVDFDRFEIHAVFSNREGNYTRATFPEVHAQKVEFPSAWKPDKRGSRKKITNEKPAGGIDEKPGDKDPEGQDQPDLGLVEMAAVEAVLSIDIKDSTIVFSLDMADLANYVEIDGLESTISVEITDNVPVVQSFLGQENYKFADLSVLQWLRAEAVRVHDEEVERIEAAAREEAERQAALVAEEKAAERRRIDAAVMSLGTFPEDLEEAEGLFSTSTAKERTFDFGNKTYYLWQKTSLPRLQSKVAGLLREKNFGVEFMDKGALINLKITYCEDAAVFDVSSSHQPERMSVASEASPERVAQMRVALKLVISFLFNHFIESDKAKKQELLKRKRDSKGAIERLEAQIEQGDLMFSRGFNTPASAAEVTWETLSELDIDDVFLAARGSVSLARQAKSTVHFDNGEYERLSKIVNENDGYFLKCLIERALDTFEEGDPEKKSIGNTLAVRILVQHMFEAGMTDKDLEIFLEMPNEMRDFWNGVFKDWHDQKVPLEVNNPLERTVGDLMNARRRKGVTLPES